jgi:hypothetical protein
MQLSSLGVIRRVVGVAALGALTALSACGGSPPADQAAEAIRDTVFDWRTDMFRGGDAAADVVNIKVQGWKKEPGSGRDGAPTMYESEWTATLRLTEPIAVILEVIDGTSVVQVVADAGEELPYRGNVNAVRAEGEWRIGASPTTSDMWNDIFQRTGGVTMGYRVISGAGSTFSGRAVMFQPLTSLRPYVIAGSAEHGALVTALQERQRIAQEAAAEQARLRQAALDEQRRQQQAAYEAEQERLRAERAEQQRIRQEEYAEQQRLAQEAAAQRAEEQRRARLIPIAQRIAGEHGHSITIEGGLRLQSVLTESQVDFDTFTVKGSGVDVRTMPFRNFTFDGAVNDRAQLVLTRSDGEAPITFGASRDVLAASGGVVLAPISASDRVAIDTMLDAGLRLGAAAPTVLTPRILSAAEALEAESAMTPVGLTGMVLWRDRVAAAVAPMFAGDLAVNRNYRWTPGENVTIRLESPVAAPALYFRGTGGRSTNLVIVINGVHRATVEAIETMGGVILPLPEGLEILEIRLDAVGTVQSRGVMLMR